MVAAGLAQLASKPRDRQNVTEWKSFFALDKFDGDERKFADWDFKLQNFLRPLAGFEEYLDWCKHRDEEITLGDWSGMVENVKLAKGDNAPDLAWYDGQLYGVLSLLCSGAALSAVKNMREEHGVGGTKLWWKLTRDVANKSGVRLERLAFVVQHPKPITDFATG